MGVITKENFVQNFKNLTAPSTSSEGQGHGQLEAAVTLLVGSPAWGRDPFLSVTRARPGSPEPAGWKGARTPGGRHARDTRHGNQGFRHGTRRTFLQAALRGHRWRWGGAARLLSSADAGAWGRPEGWRSRLRPHWSSATSRQGPPQACIRNSVTCINYPRTTTGRGGTARDPGAGPARWEGQTRGRWDLCSLGRTMRTPRAARASARHTTRGPGVPSKHTTLVPLLPKRERKEPHSCVLQQFHVKLGV